MARKPRPTHNNLRQSSSTLGTTPGYHKISRRLRVTPAPLFKENHPRLRGHGETLWAHVVAKEIDAFLDPPYKRFVRGFHVCSGPTALDGSRPQSTTYNTVQGEVIWHESDAGWGDRFSYPFK